MATDKKWMQKASASIKRRGTEGVCTGSKFGGPTCKPGSNIMKNKFSMNELIFFCKEIVNFNKNKDNGYFV
jgi:hypothetical protein